MVGIVAFGAYVPRLRLNRQAVYDANKWFAAFYNFCEGCFSFTVSSYKSHPLISPYFKLQIF